MCRLRHCERGVVPDADSGAPLGEAGTRLVELSGALLEIIQAAAPILTLLAANERYETGVHLDTGDDTVLLGQVHHQFPIRGFLVQGLSKVDRTTTILSTVLGAEHRLA